MAQIKIKSYASEHRQKLLRCPAFFPQSDYPLADFFPIMISSYCASQFETISCPEESAEELLLKLSESEYWSPVDQEDRGSTEDVHSPGRLRSILAVI